MSKPKLTLHDKDSGNVVVLEPVAETLTENITLQVDKGGKIITDTNFQELAAANGGVVLVDGKIPTDMLPSYVDDVLEFATVANFPIVGESGKIYVATDTDTTYRWGGTIYVNLSTPDVSGTVSEFETALTA